MDITARPDLVFLRGEGSWLWDQRGLGCTPTGEHLGERLRALSGQYGLGATRGVGCCATWTSASRWQRPCWPKPARS